MKRVFWVLALVLVLTQPAAAAENQGSLKIDLDTGELPVTNGAVTLYQVGTPADEGYRVLDYYGGGTVRYQDAVSDNLAMYYSVPGSADGANRRLLSLPSLPAASSHQGAVGFEAKSRHFAYRFRLPPDSRFRQAYPGPLGCGLVRPGSGAVRLAEKTETLTKYGSDCRKDRSLRASAHTGVAIRSPKPSPERRRCPEGEVVSHFCPHPSRACGGRASHLYIMEQLPLAIVRF